MRCDVEFVRQEGERFIHRCRRPECRRECRHPHADPELCHQGCAVQGTKATKAAAAASHGVGTQLMRLWRELRIKPKRGCDCRTLARDMNKLGPAGCREQRDALLARMEKNAEKYGIADKLTAGVLALWQGKPLSIAGMLDEAIRQSECRAGFAAASPCPNPRE
jgi:hypothetical protein